MSNKYSAKGPNQPYFHGFSAQQLLNWSPETDKTAKYFRSETPLAARNKTYRETQAQPAIAHQAEVITLSGDYGDPGADLLKGIPDVTRTVDAFARHNFQFWQYVDYYGAWNGMAIDGMTYDDIKEAKDTVYGVLNYPNPAYTDAAHRNGVKSLGGWFWPREDDFSEWVASENGKFPIADKMIELARYMNFDGYFINQEATVSEEHAVKLQEMLIYFKEQAPDLYIQFYDCIKPDGELYYVNGFTDVNSYWVEAENGCASDSMFMNYAWHTERLKEANRHAKEMGRDPLEIIFAGTEHQKYGFNPPYDIRQVFNTEETPLASWGLFCTDFTFSRYPGDNLDNANQHDISERDRQFWSGPKSNPTDTGRLTEENSAPYSDKMVPNDRDNPDHWDGVAHFIAEKTVINTAPFVTHFNTGHGLAFFTEGEKQATREWSNMSSQDILPSWQWWQTGEALIDFDYNTAWNGGSSLKVSQLSKDTLVNLFKMDVMLTGVEQLSVITKAKGNVKGSLVLYFKDDLENPVSLPFGVRETWETSCFELSFYEGREIGKLALNVIGESDSEIYVGELSLKNNIIELTGKPSFSVEQYLEESGEAFVTATLDEEIMYYDIWDNTNNFIDRVHASDSYLNHISKDATQLIVKPVSHSRASYDEIVVELV
ncbi:hypothetical protein OL233_06270 [Vagococcus sp. PNs007]|uniref:Cytosolic endo-beta-N-acetylglucosaminidase TIM barrel domain-containing protein n=1 Tax=Vagococcus proximus TaxID=2991417 RepID=A0ABT5X1L9_9ENTE|nr:hypothetical protein [Vagococcus proximus]MDF0479894.1 hypothetical protein [Vagococcus proximus]